jgi:hypothetical protein
MSSSGWINRLLTKHAAKEWRYSGTAQTFADIFGTFFLSKLPADMVFELLTFLSGKDMARGIHRDIRQSSTYQGHLFMGTTFSNTQVVSFAKPTNFHLNGHKIKWKFVVSVHSWEQPNNAAAATNTGFAVFFDLIAANNGLKKVTVEDDRYSLEALLLLYNKNRIKFGRSSRAIESKVTIFCCFVLFFCTEIVNIYFVVVLYYFAVTAARKLLLDLHLNLSPPVVVEDQYFNH